MHMYWTAGNTGKYLDTWEIQKLINTMKCQKLIKLETQTHLDRSQLYYLEEGPTWGGVPRVMRCFKTEDRRITLHGNLWHDSRQLVSVLFMPGKSGELGNFFIWRKNLLDKIKKFKYIKKIGTFSYFWPIFPGNLAFFIGLVLLRIWEGARWCSHAYSKMGRTRAR